MADDYITKFYIGHNDHGHYASPNIERGNLYLHTDGEIRASTLMHTSGACGYFASKDAMLEILIRLYPNAVVADGRTFLSARRR